MADLVDAAEVKTKLATRYRNQRSRWFSGGGEWPLKVPLGLPSEAATLVNLPAVRLWAERWRGWTSGGRVETADVNWRRLGTQTLPCRLVLDAPIDVAHLVGDGARWIRAARRRDEALARWPALTDALARQYDALADYEDWDWNLLLEVLACLPAFRGSGMYLRQLPIRGIDTKWIETRAGTILALLGAIVGNLSPGGLVEALGLPTKARSIDVLVLDPTLRVAVGGLRHLQASPKEIAAMTWRPRNILLVENPTSALPLPDMEGAVAIAGLGYGVDVFGGWPWLQGANCVYWGDLDSHGMAMLARARGYLPGLQQVLMDEATMENYRDLIVHLDDGKAMPAEGKLTAAEKALFKDLVAGRWGKGARLEQERIEWGYVIEAIRKVLSDH